MFMRSRARFPLKPSEVLACSCGWIPTGIFHSQRVSGNKGGGSMVLSGCDGRLHGREGRRSCWETRKRINPLSSPFFANTNQCLFLQTRKRINLFFSPSHDGRQLKTSSRRGRIPTLNLPRIRSAVTLIFDQSL